MSKARRRRKITIPEIPTYYRYATGKLEGKRGCLYYLSGNPTDAEKREIEEKYSNVVWMKAQSQYAPEIVTQCLFVFD